VSDRSLLNRVHAHRGGALAVVISRDGRTLVSGGVDGTIKFWSLPELTLRKTARAGGSVRSLAISRLGKLVASGSGDGRVRLWKMPAGSLVRTLSGHTAGVFAVAFVPGGTTLVSAGLDKTIRLWNVRTGKMQSCLIDLEANPRSKKGTTVRVVRRGKVITFTQPCGSPIPPGAICTCNCVPGSIAPPAPPPSPSPVPGTSCACNKICVCIPVFRP
jgi:WD40 repeat protein